LQKLGIEAHAYAHYTSLLCFFVSPLNTTQSTRTLHVVLHSSFCSVLSNFKKLSVAKLDITAGNCLSLLGSLWLFYCRISSVFMCIVQCYPLKKLNDGDVMNDDGYGRARGVAFLVNNNCIGHNTKGAARRSSNSISKTNKKLS